MVLTNTDVLFDYQTEDEKSLISSLKEGIQGKIASFFQEINNIKLEKKLDYQTIYLLRNIHTIKAEMETIRDFINDYYINDIKIDEEVLTDYHELLENYIDKVEKSIDDIEGLKDSNNVVNLILNAYEELYSTMVNINFTISQKISQVYLESQSDINLLEEA
ncbi:MAG: hypothetical protein KGV43_01430 [Arcobacter sp.]|nr:hypothetical protein [Arcobacter sp.]